jgi:ProP effector
MNRTDAVALLSELFPGCFAVARPLKIGIAKDIIIKVNGTLKPHELANALQTYTGSAAYLKSLRAGASRVDLDGNTAGTVTAAEAHAAHEDLATRLLKAADRKKRAPAKSAPPPPPPSSSRPKWIRLADLKRALREKERAAQS